jgi:hypothetical protein
MLTCFLSFCSVICFAQTTDQIASGDDQPTYHDLSGSALLLKDWVPGVIKFSSGRTTNQFKLKFDCIANKVLLQFNGSSFSSESKIREFVIYPKGFSVPDSMVFRKNFPPTPIANEETFYQILVADTVSLLKLMVKNIDEERQIASKVVYRRIKDVEKYYFLENGKMMPIPEDKTLIADMFLEKNEQIREFLSSRQLKFRSQSDYVELIKYYNSL